MVNMKKGTLILTLLGLCIGAAAQKANWQNLDLKTDSVFGISTERAYKELLPHKKATTVLVAVIDGGVDTAHEDLKNVLWINTKEKRGNGKDDDKNHYTDDINGWSFLGSAKGNVDYDNLELTRLIRAQQAKFGSLNSVPKDTVGLYQYKQMRAKYDEQLQEAQQALIGIGRFTQILDTVLARMHNSNPTVADLEAYSTTDPAEMQVKQVIIEQIRNYPDFKT